MADYGNQDIQCPFYLSKQDDKYRIKCEGVEKGVTTQLTFKGNKKWYINKYCCKNYEKCKVYKMLEEKYKAEG